MKIVIAGSSGLVGTALVPELRTRGHEVFTLVRRPSGARTEIEWDPRVRNMAPGTLEGVDAVVNLAGASIAGGRWTSARKRELRESRIGTAETLVAGIETCNAKPRVLVSASAVGYYGDRGIEVLTEMSEPGCGFLPELCLDWERAAQLAIRSGVRVVCPRIGLVISRKGGVFRKLAPWFSLNLGARLGDGQQWMSWISLEDLTRILVASVEDERLCGPINATAPHPVINADFSALLAASLGRRCFFSAPGWALKLALGELAQETLLGSTRALPGALRTLGFEFRHSQLPEVLNEFVNREGQVRR